MAERLTAEELLDDLAECEEAFRRHFGLLAPGRDWPVARMPTEEMLERAQHLWGPFRRGWCERGKHESAKLDALQAENERLREALRPFANAHDLYQDLDDLVAQIPMNLLSRAAAALQEPNDA